MDFLGLCKPAEHDPHRLFITYAMQGNVFFSTLPFSLSCSYHFLVPC
jgi:hypothetical protein